MEHLHQVMSVVSFSTVKTDNGEKHVTADVKAVYPHCKQCTVPLKHRRNYMHDNERGGLGFQKIPFPIHLLLEEEWSQYKERVRLSLKQGVVMTWLSWKRLTLCRIRCHC